MAARRAEDNAIQELLRREPEKSGHFCLENARGTVGYGFREWELDGKRIIAFMEEPEGQKGSGGPPGKRKAGRRKQEQQTLAEEAAGNILPNFQTYYESQWIERGLNIKYMRFALPREGRLEEPLAEIELDDYRSYKRPKRSSLEKAQ